MKVVWKRPDGFHGASPTDFKVVELDGHSKIWLHKFNHDWFPFRIAGDWGEEEATQKLNRLVNLLDSELPEWVKFLSENFANSSADQPKTYLNDTLNWLGVLKTNLKGDTWEIDIMTKALSLVEEKIKQASEEVQGGV